MHSPSPPPTSPSSNRHSPLSEPFLSPQSCPSFLLKISYSVVWFFFFFHLSLGLSRKATDTENISATVFHSVSHSQAKGEEGAGRAGTNGGKQMLLPKAQFRYEKYRPSTSYPHSLRMTTGGRGGEITCLIIWFLRTESRKEIQYLTNLCTYLHIHTP